MDSRDSLDQTPDSIDLTKSPVKHTNTQRHIEKIYKDTSYHDTDEMIDFNNGKVKKIYRKDTNERRKRAKIVNNQKGQNYKNICFKYRKKEIIETKEEKKHYRKQKLES